VSTQQIEYEDPREEPSSAVSDGYKVTKADATSTGLYFEGTGPSNSYVTLFFFSTPIIVTAQADGAGKWTYELDQELPNGEHEMYVATVNNQGKIMAQSDPVNFEKTASAIEVQPGPSAAIPTVQEQDVMDFLMQNLLLVGGLIVLVILILGVLIIGLRSG